MYHNINGKIVRADNAKIPVSDLGLLRGYGIFDFFPIRDGLPLFENDYFERFYRSAALTNLEVPVDRSVLREMVIDLAKKNSITRGFTKLVLTGGFATDGYTPEKSNLYILQHRDIIYDPKLYRDGIKLVLQKYIKDYPEIKSLNYTNVLIHRDHLSNVDGTDILYHDGRFVRETSRANFFIVDPKGMLVTPAKDVLLGVTRKQVIHVARGAGFEVVERPLPIAEIARAKEAFITSTTKGVLPVSRLNDFVIGSGKAGDVTSKLGKLLTQYSDRVPLST